MFKSQYLRSITRVSTPLLSKPPLTPLKRSTLLSTITPTRTRPFTLLLTPKRPSLTPSNTQTATLTPTALDIAPKPTLHPALANLQIRNGPRDTYDPSHRVRKRRHGFLARVKGGRKGHALLKRRRQKKRMTLSH
ncbi:hypothetical protein EG328_006809 [Venturia inaequalis]|uniref:Ribosomal protein L34 n=1 Tax=Venturia inaequalis TaxID=5025 RepID=A0A8H3ZFV4_VENIN|nr:hypothetical protein EG328_006809 [Venturia inaequalis]KAE9994703.1 hypothetical protein EG327_005149 [Venturia inaequalis]